MASDLSRFLTRAALEPAFRELALDDPDAAFAGYDLDPGDRELLRRRDPAVLALLGRAVREVLPDPERAAAAPPAAPAVPATALPEVLLLVRIQPWAVPLDDGRVQITWTAAMEPFTADDPPPSTPAPPASPASAREAADAVLAAAPEHRYARILDLVQLLAEPGGRG